MAKKLNPLKLVSDAQEQTVIAAENEPTAGTIYEFDYESEDWVKIARLILDGDVWIVEGDNIPEWLDFYMTNGKRVGDRTITVADRDFYKVLSGLTYQMFVPDEENVEGEPA